VLRWHQTYRGRVRGQLTVMVDGSVLAALRRAAARDGVPEDELVDEALRRWFGLRGLGVLDDQAERRATDSECVDDDAAMALAVREVRASRAQRRARA
jgi:hypothetical protein